MRLLLILVASIALTTYATADDFALRGVWEGTIGDKNIIACFNTATTDTSITELGSYYYLRYLSPIRLVKREGQWLEENRYEKNHRPPVWPNEIANKPSPITGVWSIESVKDRKLIGSWKSADGNKVLALRLMLVEESAKACSSNSYNAKLEQVLPKLFVGKTESFNGHPYRLLQIAHHGTVELLENNPNFSEINLRLRSGLPSDLNEEAIKDYFQMRRYLLGEYGGDAKDVDEFDELTYWTSVFLTTKHHHEEPHTGRRGVSNTYTTWDLRTGKEVDLWSWFRKESLMKFLSKHETPSPYCEDHPYYSKGQIQLTLESSGMRFWEEPDGDGCEKDFIVPYPELSPVLTEQGKSAINAVIKK
jgi:hypothetical protein